MCISDLSVSEALMGPKTSAPKTSEVKVNGEKSLLNKGYSL